MHLVDENMIHVFYGAQSGERASFLATLMDAVFAKPHLCSHTHTTVQCYHIHALLLCEG